MKRIKNLILLLVILLIPSIVNAKEYCKVLTGNGKEVGSEIVCGNEHFNVISSKENEIKMLAKYNLTVGNIIYKEKIEKEAGSTITDSEYCYNLSNTMGGTVRSDSFYNAPGYCFIEVNIDNDTSSGWGITPPAESTEDGREKCNKHIEELNQNDYGFTYEYNGMDNDFYYSYCSYKITHNISQNKNFISAHWDQNDNYLYPQVGDVYIKAYQGGHNVPNYSDFHLVEGSGEKYDNYFYDLSIGDGPISEYVDNYKDYLINLGFAIDKVDLITLDEINNIIKGNNKSIPYGDWYNHTREIVPPHYEFGSLKDYLPQDKSFLYGTTYWIKTGYDLAYNPIGVSSVAFVNSYGGVCGSGLDIDSGIVDTCYTYLKVDSQIGSGIRPVISLSPNELMYLIKTETDGHGTIDVVENASGNETIQFKVTANKGYKLKSVIIKTDSGEKVEFETGEMIKNEDGTYSVDKNKFTMPFENVTIEARWEMDIINPETGNKILLLLAALIAGGISLYTYKANNKEKEIR